MWRRAARQDISPRAMACTSRLPAALAELLDFLRHLAGGEEGLMIGIDDGGEGFGLGRQAGEFGIGVLVAIFLPLAAAFLHQPEAHDVFEKSDRSPDAAFVGVVV